MAAVSCHGNPGYALPARDEAASPRSIPGQRKPLANDSYVGHVTVGIATTAR